HASPSISVQSVVVRPCEQSQHFIYCPESLENPLCPAQEHAPARCMFWTFYHKVTSVPHAVGLVCLSAGLMFVIAALLWFPIIKDKLKREGDFRNISISQLDLNYGIQ
uniref:Uncharacterized protein n=1 Tax=Pygocentrus nattereri TaxID=42514 RepID=A0AAR2JGY3_PYGNA